MHVSAVSVSESNAMVSESSELTEVRWVSLAEADELMGGAIYEPVRRHLRGRLMPDTF